MIYIQMVNKNWYFINLWISDDNINSTNEETEDLDDNKEANNIPFVFNGNITYIYSY